MKIIIKTTNLSHSSSISDYLNEKLKSLSKFLTRYNENAVEVQVELAKTTNHHHKGDIFKAEINLHIPRKSLRAEAEHQDLYFAINDAKDKITKELKKYNEISANL